jgi:hypothetical protein
LTAGAAIGRTPAEIHERFAGVVWSNLNTPAAATRLESLSDHEMDTLAELYINASHGGPPLQGVIKQNAPAQSARYERAVVATLARRGIDPVLRWPAARQKVGSPNDFMTLSEIFMEFRSAGSSVLDSLYGASRFAGGELSWAFSAGYAAGYLAHEYVCTSGSSCDAAVGAAANALVNPPPPVPASPVSGSRSDYPAVAQDPTGGYQNSEPAPAEFGGSSDPGVEGDGGGGVGVHGMDSF